MAKIQFISFTLRISLFASAFLYLGDTVAINIDPFAFCTNSCKSPGLCQTDTKLKNECKRVCGDERMWKHVASLQLSNSSKKFRTGNKEEKEIMLYESDIAQCLEKTAKKESPTSSLLPAAIPTNNLCAAAINKEMSDLERDKAALETQKDNLGAVLKAMQAPK